MNIFAGVYSDATPIAYAVCIIWIGQRLLRRTYSFFPKHSLPATILYFLVFPVIILSSVAYSSGHKVRKAPLTSFPTVEVEGRDFNGTPGVCQISCPPNSCGVSDFRGAVFAFWVQPDGSCGLPVAGLS